MTQALVAINYKDQNQDVELGPTLILKVILSYICRPTRDETKGKN